MELKCLLRSVVQLFTFSGFIPIRIYIYIYIYICMYISCKRCINYRN
jgi:hypothetical protein